MREDKNIGNSIKELQQSIAESGYFPPELFGGSPDYSSEAAPEFTRSKVLSEMQKTPNSSLKRYRNFCTSE
jgi:hypothetical protein